MKLSRQFRNKEYWEFDIITTASPQTVGLGLGVELARMNFQSKHRIDWGDGSDEEPINASNLTHEYTTAGTYTARVWTREILTNINQINCLTSGYSIDNLDFSGFKYMRFFRFPTSGTVNITFPTEYIGNNNFQLSANSVTTTSSTNVLDVSFYEKITGMFIFGGNTNIDRIKTPVRPSSIEFNGTTQYVNLGDNNAFSFGNGTTDSPFTISAWVKMTDATNFPILCRYSTGNEEWALTTDATDKIRAVLYDDSAGTDVNIGRTWNTAVTPYEGQWAHVVMTYDGTGIGGIKIYWDGDRVDDTNLSNGSYVAMENTAADTNIARFTGFSTEHADGFITNVTLFNSELSQANITSIYDLGKNGDISSFSPNSWWKLDMTDDRYLPTITDSGSNGIDGTMIPTTIKSVTMDSNQFAQFYWLCPLSGNPEAVGPNADDPSNFEFDLSGYQMSGQCRFEGDGTNPTNVILPPTAFSTNGPSNQFGINNTGITSMDLSNLKMSSATGISISFYNNASLTSITWPTTPITGTARSFSCFSCELYAGAWDFTWIGAQDDVRFNLTDTLATSVILPSSTATIDYIYAYPNVLSSTLGACKTINLTAMPNATEQDGFALSMQDNNMNASQVNKILVDLDTNSTGGFASRIINLSGNNAAPDTTSGSLNGDAAKTNLIAKNFTVTTS